MDQEMVALEALRSANRREMGLADYVQPGVGPFTGPVIRARGMAGAVPGGVGAIDLLLPKIQVGSAFPAVDYEWDPSQPNAAPEGEGSAIGEWFTRHVIRPYAKAGPVVYNPGEGYADYSGIARFVAWLVGIGLSVGAAWVLARAFMPRRAA